jgi:hypothetical protein
MPNSSIRTLFTDTSSVRAWRVSKSGLPEIAPAFEGKISSDRRLEIAWEEWRTQKMRDTEERRPSRRVEIGCGLGEQQTIN